MGRESEAPPLGVPVEQCLFRPDPLVSPCFSGRKRNVWDRKRPRRAPFVGTHGLIRADGFIAKPPGGGARQQSLAGTR